MDIIVVLLEAQNLFSMITKLFSLMLIMDIYQQQKVEKSLDMNMLRLIMRNGLQI